MERGAKPGFSPSLPAERGSGGEVRRSLKNALALPPNAIRVQATVTALPFARRFDLIVVRHPDVDQRPDDWRRAFKSISRWLAGLLLVTTYSLPEMDRISGWLAQCELARFPLEAACLEPPGLPGRDRYVMTYRSYHN